MKVFITAVSLQNTLHAALYESDDPSLRSETKTPYPIFNLMRHAVSDESIPCDPDDEPAEYQMIAIKFPHASSDRNLATLRQGLELFEKDHAVSIPLLVIEHGIDETSSEHIALFKALIDAIPQSCEIYADITYGTKPTPIALFAALLYLQTLRTYCKVAKIVYGQIETWSFDEASKSSMPAKANIYEVTPLLTIVALAESMARLGGENVEEAVRYLLSGVL